MTRYCSSCGTPIDHSEKYCTSCGEELEPLETSHSIHQTTPASTSYQPTQNQSVVQKEPKRLYRCCCDTVLGGVCAGLAEFIETDVNLIRLVTVILALFTGGTVAIAYLIAWALLPIEPIELHKDRYTNQPRANREGSITKSRIKKH